VNSAITIIEERYDVLVVGGGTAGTIAAIQSARAGAQTILVEMSSQLGGTHTNAGVYSCAYFYVGEKQIVGGIGWEIACETLALSDGKMPDWKNPPRHRPSYQVQLDQSIYSMVSEEKVIQSGVALHYHEILHDLTWDDNTQRWQAITAGKMLTRKITAREIIDCSGDAIAVRLAGGECRKDPVRQPGTLFFSLKGYDADIIDEQAIQEAYDQAIKNGILQKGDFCFSGQPFINYLKSSGGNQQHIFGADSSDSSLQSQANIEGRQRLLKMLRFLRSQPGLGKTCLGRFNPEIGIRDTYRIIGETEITEEDYLGGKQYGDAVAYTYYFVDIHNHDGIEYKFIDPGVFPVIPLGSLIPKGMKHILTAGRTICSDRAAFSALRVQASCMAMGQAVGAASALGCQLNIPSRDVPINKLKDLLKEHNAVVPE